MSSAPSDDIAVETGRNICLLALGCIMKLSLCKLSLFLTYKNSNFIWFNVMLRHLDPVCASGGPGVLSSQAHSDPGSWHIRILDCGASSRALRP